VRFGLESSQHRHVYEAGDYEGNPSGSRVSARGTCSPKLASCNHSRNVIAEAESSFNLPKACARASHRHLHRDIKPGNLSAQMEN